MLAPNTILQNRYQIIRQLGAGGMGAVYLAYDLRLGNRFVVVKENLGGDPSQFQFEANILATLTHPNLPRVGDHFIESSGAQYLVMDYIQGQDLDTIVQQRGPLPERDTLVWIKQILAAVGYLHANRIIHRDIKPQNIIITPQNQAVLVDFGVAKQLVTGRPTLSGARAVTPGFSAPEQYRGGTDQRSDIYSLCATLYALLTASMPPDALALMGGSAILVPPRDLNRAIAPQTEQVILRGMSMQPQARFQSMDELGRALAGRLGGSAPLSNQTQTYTPPTPVRTRVVTPLHVVAAIIAGLMLMGIAAGASVFVLQALTHASSTSTTIALASLTPPIPISVPATVVPTYPPSPTRMLATKEPEPTFTPFPPPPTPVPLRNEAVTVFEDDFNGSGLDPSKWIRDNNTGNAADVGGGVLRMSSSGTRYPYVYTSSNPFPTSGDFRVSIRFRYLNIGTCGAPMALASFFLPAGVSQNESNRVSSTAEAAGGVSIWLWHEVVYYRSGSDHPNIPLPGSYTATRDVTIEYTGGRYNVFADGARIFMSNPTSARPNVIWLGNNVDLGAGYDCLWDALEVDNVKVESLP